MYKYTIAAQIVDKESGKLLQPFELSVHARSSSAAREVATDQLAPHLHSYSKGHLDILRVQRHTKAFLEGEVADLLDYGADFSPDQRYRYRLYRVWSPGKTCMFIGLNPSTATSSVNDRTVSRCIRFARDLGYGGLTMTNAFALRATNPTVLRNVDDPVGPENDRWLKELAGKAGLVIAAWGNHGKYLDRGAQIRKLIPNLHCLALTDGHEPKHPLYLKSSLKPIPL